MMTENQLEIAAREYCRLAEMDAEKKVPTSPSPNPDGSVNMVCIWVPAWKAVAEMIAQQDMVRHCIDLANVRVVAPPSEGEAGKQEGGSK
jgi:hypothetical protein